MIGRWLEDLAVTVTVWTLRRAFGAVLDMLERLDEAEQH